MEAFFKFIIKYAVLVAIAAAVSWYFYYFRRKDIFGKFAGGMVVAILGAIIFDLIFTLHFMKEILDFLTTRTYVHIPGAFLGGFLALYVLNKINHDQDRRN